MGGSGTGTGTGAGTGTGTGAGIGAGTGATTTRSQPCIIRHLLRLVAHELVRSAAPVPPNIRHKPKQKLNSMKKITLLLLTAFFLCHACKVQQEKEPQISLNDSGFIKIIAENVIDTINVKTQFCSSFPLRSCTFKNITISKPGEYFLSYRMTKPELVRITIGESFQLLLLPKDTTLINVGYKTINQESKLYFNFSGRINEYLQIKKRDIGYYTFFEIDDLPVYKFFHKMTISKDEYKEALSVLESHVKYYETFIKDYKQSLPGWFYELEILNTKYGSAYIKLLLYKKLSMEDQKRFSEPVILFNNPVATLSTPFYAFVLEYLYFKRPIDLSKPHLVSRHYRAQSDLIDSLLTGDTKKYFLSCRLADLYYFSDSAEDVKIADTIVNAQSPNLTLDQKEFINYYKALVVKALDIKDSLSQGDKAPGFYLKDMNGDVLALSNFKNKIVYVHFWATWCEPCIKEIPHLNQLYSHLTNQNFELVNICLDDNPDTWEKTIVKTNLQGINLICKGNWEKSLMESYFITELPHYTLIDGNGSIIKNKCSGPNAIYSEIVKYLDYK